MFHACNAGLLQQKRLRAFGVHASHKVVQGFGSVTAADDDVLRGSGLHASEQRLTI